MICPYCNKEAPWIENKELYGRNYGKSFICYYCKECDAYVGCHQNTKKPLGTMANAELRWWRAKAHAVIDPIWKSGQVSRGKFYEGLKQIFGKDVHIGESDIDMCKMVIAVFGNGDQLTLKGQK